MKIIAIMNQKGGIGKTMTAASVAYLMGQEWGKRVLVADADQQGNVSMLFGAFDPEGAGMSELLERHVTTGGKYRTTDLIRATPYSRIDIIPANGYLMQTNMKLLLQEQEDQVSRFAAAMVEIQGAYDYVIADCGLLMDMTVTNVLAAADLVIMPVKIGGFEVVSDGLPIGHGERSVIMIQQHGLTLTLEEIVAIRWHMGAFDDAFRGGCRDLNVAFGKYPLAVMLHLADMEATYLDEESR